MGLPPALANLLSPDAYPHAVEDIKLVETHISWIVLTGAFAYKIKRPVHFPFVDLRSAAHRAWLCELEITLNRRFAPDLYLAVCRITAGPAGARVNGSGEVLEHAVKMRQFDRSDELDRLLEADRVRPPELERFGSELARIHTELPVAEPGSQWGQPKAIEAAVARNLAECQEAAGVFADVPELAALRPQLSHAVDRLLPMMAERQIRGRVRECHGDLHCGNVVRRASGLVAFDCLEFEPAFRWIDVADEIAFLVADLQSFDRPEHALAFLRGYLARSGDYQACRLVALYASHHSLVRAKVVALSVAESAEPATVATARKRFDTYVGCAGAFLLPRRPLLILMMGLSGSGKTWLASRLAPAIGALHLRSDVERKRLAGLTELQSSGSQVGSGLYAPRFSAQVAEHLARAAESILVGGYTVIVDATFNLRADRDRFANLGSRLALPVCVVTCHAPIEVLRSRIETRRCQARDASEADTQVLEWQQAHHEPLRPEESFLTIEAITDAPDVLQQVLRQIEGIREREKGDSPVSPF